MFSHSPFFELFSNRRTWVCCVNNHFPLWCRGVKELVYCHPQPPPPSPLDCYLARGYAVVSIQLCYSSRQRRFFQPTFSPSPSTIWQVVTYLFSWRSVAPAFTGANKTLLNFITIGFCYGNFIKAAVHPVFSVIFVGPRKRASGKVAKSSESGIRLLAQGKT